MIDVEKLKADIAEIKAKEPLKYADSFVPCTIPNHSYIVNLTNMKNEIVAQSAVSEEDFDKIKRLRWHLTPDGYAKGTLDGKAISMHHFIIGKPTSGYVIDHIDRNKLNNTRENLRHATLTENSQNTSRKGRNTYIGVSRAKKKYSAICMGTYLGTFENEKDAAVAYDIYVLRTLGKDSKTNNLISYEDALNAELIIPSSIPKVVRDLPTNIHTNGKKFWCSISHNGKTRVSLRVDTIEEANEDLLKIKEIIRTSREEQ